jgi:DNA-binding NarL/FixJ family response regulator
MKRASLLLADDHLVVVEGMIQILRQDFDIAAVAQNGREMVTLAKQFRPDVVITDISMPLLNGIDAARILRKELSSTKLVFLSMHSDLSLVEEAFRAGASAFVLKMCGVEEVAKAIQFVTRGATYITPLVSGDLISTLVTTGPPEHAKGPRLTLRQREVLQLLAEGKTMKEVASVLSISTRTAESHKYEIMRQVGVQTTAQLVRYAVQIKLV